MTTERDDYLSKCCNAPLTLEDVGWGRCGACGDMSVVADMKNKWLEFKTPAVGRKKSVRVLVRAAAVQGLQEAEGGCELLLSFAEVTVAGTFDEVSERLRAEVGDEVA